MQLQHDLTVLFLTVNKLPKKWADFHKSVLLDASHGAEVITVSREPMDWGLNIIQDGEISASNIYRQMLRAAKLAKTEYVAIAEDDTLYTKEHFKLRPKGFGYNMSRWGILSWKRDPVYFYRHRESNSALIAPRKMLIECLEEYPEGAFGEVGKEKTVRQYGLKEYKVERFHTKNPIVNFHHKNAIDKMEQLEKKSERKSLIAYEIPCWGKAKELLKYFKCE